MAAVAKAVAAIEKNAAASFLQSDSASVLRDLANSNQAMMAESRSEVLAFLSSNTDESTGSEITGILKQMGDTMAATLADITGTEKASVKSFNQLIKAKTAEIDACTASIEDKMKRIGDLGVKIVGMKEDLSDAEESLVEDKKYLAELEKGCATKEKEWERHASSDRKRSLLSQTPSRSSMMMMLWSSSRRLCQLLPSFSCRKTLGRWPSLPSLP